MTRGSKGTLVVLGTAIAATAAGTANAADLVSTAGPNFAPVTIGRNPGNISSYSFDLDGDGTNDFTIGYDSSLYLQGLKPSDAAVQDFSHFPFARFIADQSPSDLSLSSVKHLSFADIAGSGDEGSNYASLATNFEETQHTGTLGYLQGNFEQGEDTGGLLLLNLPVGAAGPNAAPDPRTSTFTLLDYGLVSSLVAPVPEPATWMLMILGLGGVGTVLRRQRRREGASPVVC